VDEKIFLYVPHCGQCRVCLPAEAFSLTVWQALCAYEKRRERRREGGSDEEEMMMMVGCAVPGCCVPLVTYLLTCW
jgi:Zn-dependent alcohol dehydrogenase